MRNIIAVCIVCFFAGCNQSGSTENNNTVDSSISVTDTATINNSINKKDTIATKVPGSLFPGSDTVVAQMHINGFKEQPVLTLSIASGKMLHAIISTKQGANLRINQIEMPDSTFDGPFGKSLDYKIKTPGTYKLIIGESMMAEGQYSGDFEIKAWVK